MLRGERATAGRGGSGCRKCRRCHSSSRLLQHAIPQLLLARHPGECFQCLFSEYYNYNFYNCHVQQGYAQQYSSMMGAAAGSHDYTPPSSSATLSSSQAASSRRSPGLPSAPSAPSLTPAPLTQSNLAANCKYTDSNVGSPQDLSTTSSGGTPQPGAGPKSPDSDIEDNGPTSPMSPSPGAGASSSATATSTKKESDTKSSPPQIYPWMKRVHLGQSKCHAL